MRNDYDFDTDYMSEEEIESLINEDVDELAKAIEIDESRTSIINPARLKEIQISYSILKRIAKSKGVRIKCDLFEPFNSVGCISVIGEDIIINQPKWFNYVSNLASNIEVYPKTNGTVQINFTFHGLTKPIE